jgi:uncharacterized protein YndB with AHSA1/START domain
MDICHDFWIDADPGQVFSALSTEEGLDAWWTLSSKADPRHEGTYELYFGADYDWRASVSVFQADRVIEWTLTQAADDWLGTKVRFELEDASSGTTIHFVHGGWPGDSRHFRISSYCWAMYLRLLKRWVQHGELVPYDKRLEA